MTARTKGCKIVPGDLVEYDMNWPHGPEVLCLCVAVEHSSETIEEIVHAIVPGPKLKTAQWYWFTRIIE